MFRSPLDALHDEAGARMVPFAGWRMPLHYGSQVEEHHAVRRHCGLFDVSHMLAVDIEGAGAVALLQRVMASDPGRLQDGGAQYGCMLNERGGVIDDLLVYRLHAHLCRVVVNASRRDDDVAWLRRQAGQHEVSVSPRSGLALLALQGPEAIAVAARALGIDAAGLRRFHATQSANGWFVARTGYTGEDGLELMMPAGEAADAWQALRAAGVQPCGLGARDTLRLEAGLCLHGQDLDEETSPLESGLGWTVAWQPENRAFIGREALTRAAAGPLRRFTGLLLEGRGVLRAGQRLHVGHGEGRVTSGGFSPTLGRSIGLARLPPDAEGPCEVEIRGRRLPVRCVSPPFVRHARAPVPP